MSEDETMKRKRPHLSRMNFVHGLHSHPLYQVWKNMKARCYLKSSQHFSRYGGRGITVCDDWKLSFKKFFDWSISHGWSADFQIDRINNDGNYCPNNCRFVTRKENCMNRSSTKLDDIQIQKIKDISGISHQLIAVRFGVSRSRVQQIKAEEYGR